MAVTIKVKARFLQLACALSPENLFCDGEISHTAAMRRKSAIMAEWRQLEAEAGRKVSEDQAYQWADEVDAHARAEQAAAVAAAPKHPLVESKKAGVWVRKGKDGRSAYYIWGPQHCGSGYRVFSEFAHRFGPRELVSEGLSNLNEAVEAAEAFLRTVNASYILTKYPQYSPENVERELARLPA